jgi:hypothetical protein
MTPVLPFTRCVFLLGACLTAGTGIGLFAVPDQTADYWAWQITAPLTAAMFGAGYIGAAISLALALRVREWQRTRVVAVAALTLTSLALLATLLNLEPFAFGDGGLPGFVAVIWLAVYVALPTLVLSAFVAQERAGGRLEYVSTRPALGATRLALGAIGAVLSLIGVGLLAGWAWLAAQWPWPLPPLPSAVMGAWLCTYAAGLLWFAVRERDWARGRIAVTAAILALVLDVAAAARYWDGFDSAASAAVYVAVLIALIAVLGGAALREERRLRADQGLTIRPG